MPSSVVTFIVGSRASFSFQDLYLSFVLYFIIEHIPRDSQQVFQDAYAKGQTRRQWSTLGEAMFLDGTHPWQAF